MPLQNPFKMNSVACLITYYNLLLPTGLGSCSGTLISLLSFSYFCYKLSIPDQHQHINSIVYTMRVTIFVCKSRCILRFTVHANFSWIAFV